MLPLVFGEARAARALAAEARSVGVTAGGDLLKYLPMRPQGWAGRAFGVVMERINRPAYGEAARLLAPRPHERLLEIGFGTGGLVEALLSLEPTLCIAGVDPTETMVQVASARRAVREARERPDLRVGSDSRLPWSDRSFHGAAALHCFQFWPDPAQSFRELARVMRPGGRVVLVLRAHTGKAPAWLPNPVSRGADEVGDAARLLAEAGFSVRAEAPVASSAVLYAERS